jgi:hypothetical protein
MLFYSQSTGVWANDQGDVISEGWYAGGNLGTAPQAVNNPLYQAFHDTGPLPRNVYTLSPLHLTGRLGPAIALTPEDTAKMKGRGGFLLHLNNPARPPQSSSEGCPVAPTYADLEKIEALRSAGETQVTVTA